MSRRNQKLSTLCKDAGPHERRPSLMSIEQPEWNALAVRVGQQEPVFMSFHGDHWLRLLEASLSKSSAAVSSSSSFVGLSFEAMDGPLSLEAQVKLVSGSCFSPWMSCVLSAWEARGITDLFKSSVAVAGRLPSAADFKFLALDQAEIPNMG